MGAGSLLALLPLLHGLSLWIVAVSGLQAVTGPPYSSASRSSAMPLSTRSGSSRAAARIWVVDDDADQRRLLGTYLTDQGYDVRCLASGEQLMARLEGQRPDLVVLDVMLPGDDGLTVLRRLRDAGDDLPVVMLTARGDGVDRIIGLEQGADDYLGKPFLPRELTARIEAVLRRRVALPAGTPLAEGQVVCFGNCRLDLAARCLERDGEPVVITSGEFSLLTLSRERLIELARGPGSDTDSRSMDVQVSRVRKLVEPDPARPRYLQTVWGYGYVFVPDGQPRSR
jgi:two-component system phosphate regulon response regulator OmpR